MRRLLSLTFALGLLVLTGRGKAVSQQGQSPGPPRQVLRGISDADLAPPGTTLPPPPVRALPGNPFPTSATIPPPPARSLPVGAIPAPRVEPQYPVTPFPITPEAGPWAICAAHYSGPDAPDLARQVCLELRNKHRLPAYVFNHAEKARRDFRAEQEEQAKKYPGRRIRRYNIPEQCGVLIGGFRDFESASEYVKVVKKLPLPELKLEGGKLAYDTVNLVEPAPGKAGQSIVKWVKVNPFSTALAVRNPTIPAPAKAASKVDPFWKQLNAYESYSLLNCRKPYTLVVKEYNGSAVVQGGQPEKQSGFLSMLHMGGDKPGERLSASAAQAHELAKFLRDRRLGFEAYVLHTRTTSIVTVGGFDRLDDPAMQQMQQRLTALRFNTQQRGGDPIGLMSRAMPMEVPRP